MSTKHTPGPWEWTGLFIEHDGRAIAQLLPHGQKPNEANARLIAAAPELLEALKRAISSRILSIDFARNRTPEAIDLRRQIIAVITKATGE